MQAFHNKLAPHLLPGMNLDLPPGVSNVYYYDTIGNVSTSRLRAAPSVPKGQPVRQYSALELRPRYPIMGGWNYSFTLGWDTPLADSVGWDAKSGKYVAELPIMTIFPGAVMYDAEISVILPEGATYVLLSL
jgi:oligosaccharyltransferase complex subunit alpha (ribophorin I)